jgi:hypothetical protein
MHIPSPKDSMFMKTWTSRLGANVPLSMVSIPGTHDSVTYSSHSIFQASFSSQTQSWSILSQLEAGIRYFDLRVRYNRKGELITHHGVIDYEHLLDTFMQFNYFLKIHPQEFIITSFQAQKGADPSQDVLDLLHKRDIPILLSKSIPTVEQARGKVWVHSGLNIPFHNRTYEFLGLGGVQDKPHIYAQNNYKINLNYSVSDKIDSIYETAFKV